MCPRTHKRLAQCWVNAGPSSLTLAQSFVFAGLFQQLPFIYQLLIIWSIVDHPTIDMTGLCTTPDSVCRMVK